MKPARPCLPLHRWTGRPPQGQNITTYFCGQTTKLCALPP